MKIKFTNFRIFLNNEYDIPDTGLILLSGMSGAGKSTFIKGVLWALFGTEAVKKPCTFGANTCTVELWLDELHITRTNKPNRLIVNDRYEDAAGEACIRQSLGMTFDDFCVSSYIPQKNNSSILSLAPTEQLRLIKTIAFHGDGNINYKDRILEMVKESGDTLKNLTSKQAFTQKEYDRTRKDSIPVVLSIPVEEVPMHAERMQNYPTESKKLSAKREHLQESIRELSQLDTLNNELLELQGDVILEDNIERIDFLRAQIKLCAQKDECNKLVEQINTITQTEAAERDAQIKEIALVLWKYNGTTCERDDLHARLYLIRENINHVKSYTKYITALNEYGVEDLTNWLNDTNSTIADLRNSEEESRKTLVQLKKDYEDYKLSEQLLTCPNCECKLNIDDGVLHVVSNVKIPVKRDYYNDIRKCERDYALITKNLRQKEDTLLKVKSIKHVEKVDGNIKELEAQANSLEKFIIKHDSMAAEYERLKNPIESAAVKVLRVKLERLEKSISGVVEIPDLTNAEEELATLQAIQQENTYKRAQREKLAKKISDIKAKVKGSDLETLRMQHRQILSQIEELDSEHAKDTMLSTEISAWEKYSRILETLNHWEKELKDISIELKIAEEVHTANLVLKEKYVQAEILAVDTTINSINEHTKYYLETFFTEHELSAILVPTGGASLKIESVINYKGNTYDNISQLSGGEFDRCTLASICGINSMLGSKILLLDESLSALDSETNTEILTFLKGLSADKLILVCSHEAVTGIFDSITTF